MATIYVGPSAAGDADGTSWANRYGSLNAAEDRPVAAADTVYVGPGCYREMLTCDVSGNAGNPITYIGDVTGEHTDGIGGIVRVTGSDNDQTATRSSCIYDGNTQRNYRTFRGFMLDGTTTHVVYARDAGTHWIIEDCCIESPDQIGITIEGANQANFTIRRCQIHAGVGTGKGAIYISHSSTLDDVGHVVENCILSGRRAVQVVRVGGITIRNCLLSGTDGGVYILVTLAAGQTVTVNNCVLWGCTIGFNSVANDGTLVENYNCLARVSTARVNTSVGANSNDYPALLLPPTLHAGASLASGFKLPWLFGELSEWSPIRAITGSNEPSTDFFGIPRPATAAKNSWGPVQFVDRELESTTVQAGSYGRVINDAGQTLVRRIPTTNAEITISLYMRYETNYAGSLPRMVVKQPGQADQTDVMVAAAGTWEQLSVTFTPAALPKFVEVWAESRNTAAAGDYATFYDTLSIS